MKRVSVSYTNINGVYKPLFFSQVYLLLTLFLYFLGPVDFTRVNSVSLVVLLIYYQGLFVVGYIINQRFFHVKEQMDKLSSSRGFNRGRAYFFCIFCLTYSIFSLVEYTNINLSNIFNILDYIGLALAMPLDAYQQALYSSVSSYTVLLLVLFSPVYFIGLALLLVNFNKLPFFLKIVLVLILLLECARWILQGKNKGVFDVFFLIFSIFLIKYHQHVSNQSSSVKKGGFKNIVVLVTLSVAVLSYFNNAIFARKEGVADYSRYADSYLVQVLPEFMTPLLVNLTDYLTQGYHSLSYVFKLEWIPTYGFGFSHVMLNNFGVMIDPLFFERTYQFRLREYSIDPMVNWHSAYLWFANDVHWLGVGFLMMIFGFLYSHSWMQSIVNRDVISYTLFYLMNLFIFYIPANTQIFMQTGTFMTFVVCICYLTLKALSNRIK